MTPGRFSTRGWLRWVVLWTFIGFAPRAFAAQPGFFLVGLPADAPVGSISSASKLSNHAIATGYAEDSAGFYRAGFVFSANGGRVDMPPFLPTDRPNLSALGISGDAQQTVGYLSSAGTHFSTRAFRRREGGPTELLQVVGDPAASSEAHGISDNGSIIVGRSGGGPCFWRADGTGLSLPELSIFRGGVAYDVSSDGTVAVGVSGFSGNINNPNPGAARWSITDRTVSLLGSISTDPIALSTAYGISGDGRIIVGRADDDTGIYQAVRWDANGTAFALGHLPGSFGSEAWGVSADGRIIGGLARIGNDKQAFVWTQATGMIAMVDYLQTNNIVIPTGWRPSECFDVSGDGLSFCGRATNAAGDIVGFVATIPNPGSAVGLSILALAVTARKRR